MAKVFDGAALCVLARRPAPWLGLSSLVLLLDIGGAVCASLQPRPARGTRPGFSAIEAAMQDALALSDNMPRL
jgi:hypothetical protein